VIIRLLPLVFALSAPTMGMSACLDATALDKGVLVTFADQSWTAVTRRDGDLLQLNHQAKALDSQIRPEGRDIRHAYFGVYPTLIDRLDGDYTLLITRTYDQQLPKPEAGIDFVVEIDKVAGIKSRNLLTRFVVTPGTEITVGSCTYTTWIVDEQHLAKMPRADPPGSVHYIPELGFGLPVVTEITAIEPLP